MGKKKAVKITSDMLADYHTLSITRKEWVKRAIKAMPIHYRAVYHIGNFLYKIGIAGLIQKRNQVAMVAEYKATGLEMKALHDEIKKEGK